MDILKKEGLKPQQIYIWEGRVLFIRVLFDNEHILIYVPSSFKLGPTEEFGIPGVQIQQVTPSKPVDSEVKIEELFKPINIGSELESIIWSNYLQLEKFKSSVRDIPYKLAIVGNSITVINRHNEVDSYIVFNKELGWTLDVFIELPSFIEKLATYKEDIKKIRHTFRENLFLIHLKQIESFKESKKQVETKFNTLLSEYTKHKNNYSMLIKFDRIITEANKEIRKLETLIH